ncbi:MAG: bifunctional diaminohydroxyphosphoribosylaminopyrimidine deaminase/5-amino-6-(5-phosphoribosylamino)uracil reductase RibD [Chitinophagaceae bacterium]
MQQHTQHIKYMQRCLQLAALGNGYVAPNPMVGAVLVYNDIIIGEGYHQQYGRAHAEVNCLQSVAQEHQCLIAEATLYVSLEPCNHFGKTPPCVDAILKHNIKHVVIGCVDTYSEVAGKGIERLRAHGVNVVVGILEDAATYLNRKFFTYHTQQRPYITLKWAQTADGFIGMPTQRVLISNAISQRFNHRLRSSSAAILVGSNTALVDNPLLDNRLGFGRPPVRMLIDRYGKVPATHHLLQSTSAPTWVFTVRENYNTSDQISVIKINEQENTIQQVLQYAYDNEVQSILVEGGAVLLQAFIEAQLWDEAYVITNTAMYLQQGVKAPKLQGKTSIVHQFENDCITLIEPEKN